MTLLKSAKLRQPNKMLVFRFGQIGDTVAALPSLWLLRKNYPDTHIVLLSEIPAKSTYLPPEAVLPQADLVNGFVKYPGGGSLKNIFSAWMIIRKLRRQGFDTLVYLVPSERTFKQRIRDWCFFNLCGIHRFLGCKGFKAAAFLEKKPGDKLPRQPKEADALLSRLKHDGLLIPGHDQGCMDLMLTRTESDRVECWWKQNIGGQVSPGLCVAICIGGKKTSQLWTWENYLEVGKKLIKAHGLFPIIVGGDQDVEIGNKMVAAWGAGVCSAGKLSVRESAALMAKTRFYLGNDTGVMHLAAAVGRPCVGVFSARNGLGIWEPYGHGHKILRVDVPCAGCQLADCNRNLECLTAITVDQVFQACSEVIERT